MGILFVTINLCHKIPTQRIGGNWAQKLPKMLSIAVFYEYTMRFTCKKEPPRAKTNLLLMLPERHAVCTDQCERICLFFLLEAAWVSCGQSGPPRSAKANPILCESGQTTAKIHQRADLFAVKSGFNKLLQS